MVLKRHVGSIYRFMVGFSVIGNRIGVFELGFKIDFGGFRLVVLKRHVGSI